MFIAFDLKSQAKELQPGHVIVLCSWETPLSRTVKQCGKHKIFKCFYRDFKPHNPFSLAIVFRHEVVITNNHILITLQFPKRSSCLTF